jgi:hypothetical protein
MTSFKVIRRQDGTYHLSINGQDYYYRNLKDVQSRVGGLIVPNERILIGRLMRL